jgi:hypothetical protein
MHLSVLERVRVAVVLICDVNTSSLEFLGRKAAVRAAAQEVDKVTDARCHTTKRHLSIFHYLSMYLSQYLSIYLASLASFFFLSIYLSLSI